MNKALILILTIVISNNVFGQQNFDTIFYNGNWEITSKEYANYFRLSHFDSENMCFTGAIKDYFIDERLQMTGFYNHCNRDGFFIFYKTKTDSFIISYEKGERNGKWAEYSHHGKTYKECNYTNRLEKVINFKTIYSDHEVVNGNGFVFEKRNYNLNSQEYTIQGEVVDSLKEGKWIIYNSHGKKVLVEYYDNGILLKSKPIIKNNEYGFSFLAQIFYLIEEPSKLKITESLEVEREIKIKANQVLLALNNYTQKKRGLIEKSNRINGYEDLETFLDKNILFNKLEADSYPDDDTIIVQFMHNIDFSISNIEFIKPSYSLNLNEEIVNVFESIDKIILQKELSEPLKVKYKYKLKFPLTRFPKLLDK